MVVQCFTWPPRSRCRYMASALSNSILMTTADNSDFKMLVGISDSSTYNNISPSWGTPASYQQKCYVADMSHPAADVAAQAATGLAMSAKVLATYGTAADATAARQYTQEAMRAYAYAKLIHETYGIDGICFRSAAVRNCVGSGCTKFEPDGDPTRSVRHCRCPHWAGILIFWLRSFAYLQRQILFFFL